MNVHFVSFLDYIEKPPRSQFNTAQYQPYQRGAGDAYQGYSPGSARRDKYSTLPGRPGPSSTNMFSVLL